jgi:hypothetical protein
LLSHGVQGEISTGQLLTGKMQDHVSDRRGYTIGCQFHQVGERPGGFGESVSRIPRLEISGQYGDSGQYSRFHLTLGQLDLVIRSID